MKVLITLFVMLIAATPVSPACAQYKPTDYNLYPLPVEDSAVAVGVHKSRLDYAMTRCGGSHYEDRIYFYGKGRRESPRLHIDTYNNETMRVSLHSRFNGIAATCRELLSHYGPDGSLLAGVWVPLESITGQPEAPKPWMVDLCSGSGKKGAPRFCQQVEQATKAQRSPADGGPKSKGGKP